MRFSAVKLGQTIARNGVAFSSSKPKWDFLTTKAIINHIIFAKYDRDGMIIKFYEAVGASFEAHDRSEGTKRYEYEKGL